MIRLQCRRIGRSEARQNFSKWIEALPPPPPDSKLVWGQLPTHHHNHPSNGHKQLHSNPIVGGKKALARIMLHRNHKEARRPLPSLVPFHSFFSAIVDHVRHQRSATALSFKSPSTHWWDLCPVTAPISCLHWLLSSTIASCTCSFNVLNHNINLLNPPCLVRGKGRLTGVSVSEEGCSPPGAQSFGHRLQQGCQRAFRAWRCCWQPATSTP